MSPAGAASLAALGYAGVADLHEQQLREQEASATAALRSRPGLLRGAPATVQAAAQQSLRGAGAGGAQKGSPGTAHAGEQSSSAVSAGAGAGSVANAGVHPGGTGSTAPGASSATSTLTPASSALSQAAMSRLPPAVRDMLLELMPGIVAEAEMAAASRAAAAMAVLDPVAAARQLVAAAAAGAVAPSANAAAAVAASRRGSFAFGVGMGIGSSFSGGTSGGGMGRSMPDFSLAATMVAQAEAAKGRALAAAAAAAAAGSKGGAAGSPASGAFAFGLSSSGGGGSSSSSSPGGALAPSATARVLALLSDREGPIFVGPKAGSASAALAHGSTPAAIAGWWGAMAASDASPAVDSAAVAALRAAASLQKPVAGPHDHAAPSFGAAAPPIAALPDAAIMAVQQWIDMHGGQHGHDHPQLGQAQHHQPDQQALDDHHHHSHEQLAYHPHLHPHPHHHHLQQHQGYALHHDDARVAGSAASAWSGRDAPSASLTHAAAGNMTVDRTGYGRAPDMSEARPGSDSGSTPEHGSVRAGGHAGAAPSFAAFDAAWATTMASRPADHDHSHVRTGAAGSGGGPPPRTAPPPPPPPPRSPPQRPPGSPQRSGRASPANAASGALQAPHHDDHGAELPSFELSPGAAAASPGQGEKQGEGQVHGHASPMSRSAGILGPRESTVMMTDWAASGGEPTWLARSRHLVVRPGPAADFPAAHLMAALQPIMAVSAPAGPAGPAGHSAGFSSQRDTFAHSLGSSSLHASPGLLDAHATPRLPPAAGSAFAHPLWDVYRRGDDLLLQAVQSGTASAPNTARSAFM